MMRLRLRYVVTLAAAAVASFALSAQAGAATTADGQASQVEAAQWLMDPSGSDDGASIMDDSKPDWLTTDQ